MSRRAPVRASHLVLAVVLVASAAGRAGAKVSLQVLGGVAAGWTDNILNAPTQVVALQLGRQSDFFFQIAPGAALASATPRLLQRLAYTFSADLFVRHSEANSFTNTLDWSGFVAASPTVDILLTLQSQQGRLNTFNLQAPSAGGQVVPALTGATSTNFFSQTVSEAITWTPRAQWRAVETGFFRAFIPTDRGQLPNTYNFIAELGADRIFTRDSIGFLARADYVDFAAVRDPNTNVVTASEQQQIITAAVARWRRDWSPAWSTEGALGVVEAMNATDGSGRAWQPSVLAAARWFRDQANAELRYAHDAVPNPLAGTSFAYDEVALTGAAPLGSRSHLFVGATAAYLHVRQISAAAGLTDTTASIVQCDVTLGWQPRPEFDLYARYSLFDQFGSPPIDMTTQAALPSILRNTVLIGINVVYPAVAAARVPTRQGTRVDRTDQPGFPEMHQQPPR
jgi:hypothetical protein